MYVCFNPPPDNYMGSYRSIPQIIIGTGLLITTLVLSIQLISLAKQSQEVKIDLAEINHIRYGLLNVDEWTEHVAVILGEKINEFEVTPENQSVFQKSVADALYMLIDEVELMMMERTSGHFSGFKRWVAGFALDVEQLRDSVPTFSASVMDELNKPETKEALQSYLNQKLDEFTAGTYNQDQMLRLRALLHKYESNSKAECRELLSEGIELREAEINLRVILILAFVSMVFMLMLLSKKKPGHIQITLLILSSFCLLLGGITTPMIDLEARIDMLIFQLMGEEVIFRDNIIFFQSKSITDVVVLLMKEGTLQMIFVGLLIFIFSIVFPSLKLISSYLYSQDFNGLRKNGVIRFFVIKSGKWSMADVMVVAIFMAFIGLNGIISSQLDKFRQNSEPVEILTTNGTQLLGGFYLFLFFCLSGLILSEVLLRIPERKQDN